MMCCLFQHVKWDYLGESEQGRDGGVIEKTETERFASAVCVLCFFMELLGRVNAEGKNQTRISLSDVL